jgi:hypothetical protein
MNMNILYFNMGLMISLFGEFFALWLPKKLENLEILLICKFEEKCPKNGKICECFQITKLAWDLQNELIIGLVKRCSSCHLIY